MPLDSPGLWVGDGLAGRSVLGCWLRCQGVSLVRCLWVEPEQVLVWLRWALEELTEQRRLERGPKLLEPWAWALVWAQMVRERRVLLQVRQPRECFVGSQAFVVLLDATRASAR